MEISFTFFAIIFWILKTIILYEVSGVMSGVINNFSYRMFLSQFRRGNETYGEARFLFASMRKRNEI